MPAKKTTIVCLHVFKMDRPSLYKIVFFSFAAMAAGTLAQGAEISPLEVGVTTSLGNMPSPGVLQAHAPKSPGILRNKFFLFLAGTMLAAFFAAQCLKFFKSAPAFPAEMETLPEEEEQLRPYPVRNHGTSACFYTGENSHTEALSSGRWFA